MSELSSVFIDYLNEKSNGKSSENVTCQPEIFNISVKSEMNALSAIIKSHPDIEVTDTIISQLTELIKSRNPTINFSQDEMNNAISLHLNGIAKEEYGVWAFYPWNNKLIHLLGEKEFIELRTNRNRYKITDQEEDILINKKIGIIGLSVGQSVAVAIAMERICGELRLADFDTLELSNYNRIKTGLFNLGLLKTVAAAREIAEIDPYIKVVCFHNGVNEDNINDFFTKDGNIDLLVEECDSLDIKVLSRQKAKEFQIPVLMDTNDRGMLDIERYDLNPAYPLFHGLIGDISYQNLKGLTVQQKVPFLLQLIGLKTASVRSKVSLIELGQSISNFPQLGSSTLLGGAIVTDVSRRILLDQLKISGRFYIDIEEIIQDKKEPVQPAYLSQVTEELSLEDMRKISSGIPDRSNIENTLSGDIIKSIVSDAGKAPSSGNDQPWKWFFKNARMFLFHDVRRSESFGDYRNMASYISLGSALENFVLSANHHRLEATINLFPLKEDLRLIAVIDLDEISNENLKNNVTDGLYNFINDRCTNRKITPHESLPEEVLKELTAVTESIDGAKVDFITDKGRLIELGKIISSGDRIRILHPHGHNDFFKREIRWTREEASAKRNGMLVQTLEIPAEALMALNVVSDDAVIKVLRDIDGAQAFKNVSVLNTISASAMGLITMPHYSPEDFIMGGMAVQRQWLKSTALGYAYQPMIAPLYLFPRIIFGNGEDLTQNMIQELKKLREKFLQIFPGNNERGEVLLFRIFKADKVMERSLRLPLDDILFFDN